MHVDFTHLAKAEAYRLLTHTVIPRPIAWVLTENENHSYNLAPFSYFNMVSSDPGLLMISVGHKRDGSKKDTWANIERRRRCVVHIASGQHLSAVNETARSLPAEASELVAIDASLIDEPGFDLPRLSACAVAFDCQLYDLHLLGDGPQAVIYLQVKAAYLADELLVNDPTTPDAQALDPLARLGGDDYAQLGAITGLPRPD